MTAFRGAIWKIGTKDSKVYVELWDADDTHRLVEAELPPDKAYEIGMTMVEFAKQQGHRP